MCIEFKKETGHPSNKVDIGRSQRITLSLYLYGRLSYLSHPLGPIPQSVICLPLLLLITTVVAWGIDGVTDGVKLSPWEWTSRQSADMTPTVVKKYKMSLEHAAKNIKFPQKCASIQNLCKILHILYGFGKERVDVSDAQ